MLVRSILLARARRIHLCCGPSSKPLRILNQPLEKLDGLLLIFQSGFEIISHISCVKLVQCTPSIRNASGSLVGVVPLYLKSHSYGEYVFVCPLLPSRLPFLSFGLLRSHDVRK